MADEKDHEQDQPKVHDKRKIDPETGEAREAAPVGGPDDGADSVGDVSGISDEALEALLSQQDRDLVAEYRDRAARAEAELVNFRTRVERDRAANREAVIADVIRGLLPVLDDLDRAEAHGDLEEGSPLAIVAQKFRASFDRYGLVKIGEKGEPFDHHRHDAIAQLPSADVTVETIADVAEPGYLLGERLVRAAKVAVFVPQEPASPADSDDSGEPEAAEPESE